MLARLFEGRCHFSEDALRTLGDARNEALRHGHAQVRTEHLLLSALRDEMVAGWLEQIGTPPARIRAAVEGRLPAGQASAAPAELKYDAYAKKVLEYAIMEAHTGGGKELQSRHLFVGLLREKRGLASVVLKELGVELEHARTFGSQEPTQPRFRLRVDDSSDRSIHEQLVAQVTEAIATRELRPGERMPTVRRLADELDVAPGTVARAYSELERRGLVITEGARGTRVAEPPREARGERAHHERLVELLRPVSVTAFHIGADAAALRAALDDSMIGIFEGGSGGS
jgi:GntR family transcriptional regulator